MYNNIYTYIYMCICIHMYIYIFLNIIIYIYIYIYMYVYIYIVIPAWTPRQKEGSPQMIPPARASVSATPCLS